MKALRTLLAITSVLVSFTAVANDDVVDVDFAQPPITTQVVPENPHDWNLSRHLKSQALRPFEPNVPSYLGKGNLISSWNPHPTNVKGHPTFIIIHGGHGISPNNIDTAVWAIRTFDANVMILDSFWTRGKEENWKTWTRYGANMRMLDVIAAARFVKDQGADPRKTVVIGDSQGGWTVLRAFSNHNLTKEVNAVLAGGAALYPNCFQKESFWGGLPGGGGATQDIAPPLGNYTAPIIVFTGTADTATPTSQCNVDKVLKATNLWLSFEGATHAWDTASGGIGRPGIDGKCVRALNVYNRFAICRSNEYTDRTRNEVSSFVARIVRNVDDATSKEK